MSFTGHQKLAITSDGNVLVVAGAGTGKTRTLVERCCQKLISNKCSLDEILMVTFTEAAAAEMRHRIALRLQEQLNIAEQNQDVEMRERFEQQLALLDTAHVCTLHSFCLKLIRQHFHQLEIDPQVSVLTEEQLHPIVHDTFDAMFESCYREETGKAAVVKQLVRRLGRGSEEKIRGLVLKLHRYSQALADPHRWFAQQQAYFSNPEPALWREWLVEAFQKWREEWLPELMEKGGIEGISMCARAFNECPASPSLDAVRLALCRIAEARDTSHWPRGTATTIRNEILGEFFQDAAFLASLVTESGSSEPLAEDWTWVREQMLALLHLTHEFGEKFTRAKREAGGIDFADIEQLALRALWDTGTDTPREAACQWQQKLRFLFVDEYQDINAAQDAILRALSRDGEHANRFLVGDVKQSIYRFRLANPHIFQDYKKRWQRGSAEGAAIPLSDNFRSREALLQFINPLFASLMREELGGVVYDSDAELKFGDSEKRQLLSAKSDGGVPRVELHLRGKKSEENGDDDSAAGKELADLEAVEKEARLIAIRLHELRATREPVWDDALKQLRPAEWKDMVVLLRAPSSRAEAFAKEFSRMGVPLNAERGGFYEASEVGDLLCLLQLLDNPLQDIPLLAVLRSPLAGLTLEELARIRTADSTAPFWTALQKSRQGDVENATRDAINSFLDKFDSWRCLARQSSLSDCLETVLADTCYEAFLMTQPRGSERVANVRKFVALARQFDPYQRQGLFRFLRFVETQADAEVDEDPAPAPTTNAVRLMSIHRSKGLEFPIVVVADLGKGFNVQDLNGDFILDDFYGLCPRVMPPHIEGYYPSLSCWLAKRRQKRELYGEEMRLLYVALTRARDRLILTGTATTKDGASRWRSNVTGAAIPARQLLRARSYLDWLKHWLPRTTCDEEWKNDREGENPLLRWTLYEENDPRLLRVPQPGTESTSPGREEFSEAALDAVTERVRWSYPFSSATIEPAKTSVSVLRRRSVEDEESHPWFMPAGGHDGRLSAAETGTAHHLFLQFVSIEKAGSREALQHEAERLHRDGVLSAEQTLALNMEALWQFWSSELGERIRAQSSCVHRELPFTARFSPAELAELSCTAMEWQFAAADDFVVVQGVVDLAVILPNEIWILDFKTDHVSTAAELLAKAAFYKPQLAIYSEALARIYRRAVTSRWLHFLAMRRSEPV